MLDYFAKIDKKKLDVVNCSDFRIADLWVKFDIEKLGMVT